MLIYNKKIQNSLHILKIFIFFFVLLGPYSVLVASFEDMDLPLASPINPFERMMSSREVTSLSGALSLPASPPPSKKQRIASPDTSSSSSSSSSHQVTLPVFDNLFYESNYPDSYTILLLDRMKIPASRLKQSPLPENRAEFEPIRHWLKETLFAVRDDREVNQLSCSTFQQTQTDLFSPDYYWARLQATSQASSSEYLTNTLGFNGCNREEKQSTYRASMLILPIEGTSTALGYLFGFWPQLLNRYAIVRDWGLRLVASKQIFSKKGNLKRVYTKNYGHSNPTSYVEAKEKLTSIEAFENEVGAKILTGLSLVPKYSKDSSYKPLIKGKDWLRFRLRARQASDTGTTQECLIRAAEHFYQFAHDIKNSLHPCLSHYLDREEINAERCQVLSKELLCLLSSEEGKDHVFMDPGFWKEYKKGLFSYGSNKGKKTVFEALNGEIFSLEDEVFIQSKKRKGAPLEGLEPIGQLIFTNVIPYRGAFYRFDRGRWFSIDDARFDAIAASFRSSKTQIPVNQIFLPVYAEESQSSSSRERTTDYKEIRYNRKAVAHMIEQGKQALLLDRINISFADNKNLFEFGDIFLRDGEKYYLIHVKRHKTHDLDHHRTQVERCSDYLHSNFSRKKDKHLLLEGLIQTFYAHNGIEKKNKKSKEKLKNTQLTNGNYFFQKIQGDFKTKIITDEFKKNLFRKESIDSINQESLKSILRELETSDFSKEFSTFITSLDALMDCAIKKALSRTEISDFLESVQQTQDLQDVLFSDGLISQDIRRQIVIVMAVIDDREEKHASLFKKQHLWGLDRTRQLVQKQGFGFKLTVVNEEQSPGIDIFGLKPSQ